MKKIDPSHPSYQKILKLEERAQKNIAEQKQMQAEKKKSTGTASKKSSLIVK